MDARATGSSRPFMGWRMVAIAFLSYNCGLGMVIGMFGTLLPTLQHDLHTTRAAASSAFGLMQLVICLLAPVVGNLGRKIRLRTLMISGSILNAVGFLLLVYANNLTEVLVLFGVVVGSAGCLMGVIPAPTLVSRWFDDGRGKALGLTTMPLLILISPPIAAFLIDHGGSRLLFLSLSGAFVALIPVLSMVIEKPEDVGQTPLRSSTADKEGGKSETPQPISKATVEIITDTRFWLLNIGIGILTASGFAFVSQGAAIAIEAGASLVVASTILSTYGAGMMAGAIGYGWLVDRIGPFLAMIVCLAVATLSWFSFVAISTVPAMLVLAGLIGTVAGATMVLQTAVMSEIFGARNLSRALGYSYIIQIPFLFGAAPLSGYLYDHSGNYASTLLFYASALAVGVAIALLLAFDRRNRRGPTPVTAAP